MNDPLEQLLADTLDAAGIRYLTGDGGHNRAGLDFYLPDQDLHIEVKRFHSDRIAGQMARAPNVIAVQGEASVRWLADLLKKYGKV